MSNVTDNMIQYTNAYEKKNIDSCIGSEIQLLYDINYISTTNINRCSSLIQFPTLAWYHNYHSYKYQYQHQYDIELEFNQSRSGGFKSTNQNSNANANSEIILMNDIRSNQHKCANVNANATDIGIGIGIDIGNATGNVIPKNLYQLRINKSMVNEYIRYIYYYLPTTYKDTTVSSNVMHFVQNQIQVPVPVEVGAPTHHEKRLNKKRKKKHTNTANIVTDDSNMNINDSGCNTTHTYNNNNTTRPDNNTSNNNNNNGGGPNNVVDGYSSYSLNMVSDSVNFILGCLDIVPHSFCSGYAKSKLKLGLVLVYVVLICIKSCIYV